MVLHLPASRAVRPGCQPGVASAPPAAASPQPAPSPSRARVLPDGPDALHDDALDLIRWNRLGRAGIPAVALRSTADVVAVDLAVVLGRGRRHGLAAGGAAKQSSQQVAVAVLRPRAAAGGVVGELLLDPVPELALQDGLVLALVERVVVADHADVERVAKAGGGGCPSGSLFPCADARAWSSRSWSSSHARAGHPASQSACPAAGTARRWPSRASLPRGWERACRPQDAHRSPAAVGLR